MDMLARVALAFAGAGCLLAMTFGAASVGTVFGSQPLKIIGGLALCVGSLVLFGLVCALLAT